MRIRTYLKLSSSGYGSLPCLKSILPLLLFTATAVPAISGETFTINTADQPPYSTLENKGIYDVIIQRMFKSTGLTITINHLPSARSIENVDIGLDDAEYARISGLSDTYKNLVMVNEKLIDFSFTAFSKNSAISIKSWESLSRYHVAFIRGWKIYETHVTHARSIIQAASEKDLFKLLEKDRVDIILYERLRGADYMKRNNISGIHSLDAPLSVRGMYLYLNRKHHALVPVLDNALRALKTSGEYDDVIASFLQ